MSAIPGHFTPPGTTAGAGTAPPLAEAFVRIGGMHCAACAVTVEQALRSVPGVRSAEVSAAGGHGSVRWDPRVASFDALQRAVAAAGYTATPDGAGAARRARRSESRTALWRLFVAAFCAMQVMMFATPAYVAGPGELAPDLKRLLDWASWLLTLPVLGFAAAPFFSGAWRSLRSGRVGMDVPVALGLAVAFVASSGAAFDPGGAFGNEVWFDSISMFVAFLQGARWLEMRARHRAEEQLEQATARVPERVQRERTDGGTEEVDASALAVGDVVRVPVGQAFAADGAITAGTTEADEALLTGESRPAPKSRGDAVVAGSINLSRPVTMIVQRVGADTRYEAIVALMKSARSQRPALLAAADRWAGAFTVGVLLLAAAAALFWSVVEPARAVSVFVAVLVVTCPCALSLATPAALLAAAGAMGRRGVVLRNVNAIEKLARASTVFVDKTGTLTEPRLELVAVQSLTADAEFASLAALRAIAASLAAWSQHPLSQALAASAAPAAMEWRDLREVAGRGIEAADAHGRRWRLGACGWAGQAESVPANIESGAETVLGRDGRALLRFVFDERLRAGTEAAVQSLQSAGVRVRLVSGDAGARVQRLAARLGLDGADGALGAQSPEAKLAAVQAAQAAGEVVAMVGDGINDAPVLAAADVSFAMAEGAAVARTQADGVLVGNRLADLQQAHGLARRAMRVARQNLAWACVYNAACVPLAAAGLLPPWAAGLGMAASSLVVVLNALRLSR